MKKSLEIVLIILGFVLFILIFGSFGKITGNQVARLYPDQLFSGFFPGIIGGCYDGSFSYIETDSSGQVSSVAECGKEIMVCYDIQTGSDCHTERFCRYLTSDGTWWPPSVTYDYGCSGSPGTTGLAQVRGG